MLIKQERIRHGSDSQASATIHTSRFVSVSPAARDHWSLQHTIRPTERRARAAAEAS